MIESMLNIANRELNYISNPECWGELPYDYLSMCYYYLNDRTKAIRCCKLALAYLPNNDRLLRNLEFFENM